MDITSAQCRAARALVGLSQQELADQSAVSKRTIASFELGQAILPAMKLALRHSLEAKGVIFIAENGEGPGVRMKKVTGI